MHSVELPPGVKDKDPCELGFVLNCGRTEYRLWSTPPKTCFQIKVSHVCLIVCLLQINYLESFAPANAEFGRQNQYRQILSAMRLIWGREKRWGGEEWTLVSDYVINTSPRALLFSSFVNSISFFN